MFLNSYPFYRGDNKIMKIEQDDYFCVLKGVKLNNSPFFGFSGMYSSFDNVGVESKQEIRHDRSYGGLIFKALAVCEPLIAAEVVFSNDSFFKVGHKMSIDSNEMELWTVTKQYFEALKK